MQFVTRAYTYILLHNESIFRSISTVAVTGVHIHIVL